MVIPWLLSWWRRPRLGHLRVVVYTRRGCHLCETAWHQLRRAQRRHGFRLEAVEVDTDPDLAARLARPVRRLLAAARRGRLGGRRGGLGGRGLGRGGRRFPRLRLGRRAACGGGPAAAAALRRRAARPAAARRPAALLPRRAL